MSALLSASAAPTRTAARCPFWVGAASIDALLAEIGNGDLVSLDAALDLRSLMAERADAEHCLRQLCRLRARLDGAHFLAFYRVRHWVSHCIVAQFRPHRTASWADAELPLDFARVDELVNACLARLDEAAAPQPLVRFAFRHPAAA